MAKNTTLVSEPSTDKENRPHIRAVRKVSISGMFNQTRTLRRQVQPGARDTWAPRDGGISKLRKSKQSARGGSAWPRRFEHPLSEGFADAVSEYRDGLAAFRRQQLEPVFDELVARVHGLDVSGKALDVFGSPTEAQIEAIAKEETALSESLDQERITIQITRSNGKIDCEERKLGTTIQDFRKTSLQKHAEFGQLLQQLKDVNAEIRRVEMGFIQTEERDVKKAKAQFQIELGALVEKARATRLQAQAEVKSARKDDELASMELNRKVQDFMKSL